MSRDEPIQGAEPNYNPERVSSHLAVAAAVPAAALALLLGGPVWAQQPVPDPAPDKPAPEQPAGPTVPPPEAIAGLEQKPTTTDRLADSLRPLPGGLTPKDAADRARTTSPAVKLVHVQLRAAAARVDQALAAYFPRLTLAATYTRVSEVDSAFGGGGINLGSFEANTPLGPMVIEVPPIEFPATEFPTIQNQYMLSAALTVPVSDYLLRLTQAYATVSLDVDAKRLEIRAEELKVDMDAQVAYFNWIRARGQRVVTELSVERARAHVEDAKKTLQAGLISEADLLRIEAQLAQARHLTRASRNFEKLAEAQLRTVMHIPRDTPIAIGIDVMAVPPPERRTIPELQRLALQRRLELKALSVAKRSLKSAKEVIDAAHYPRLDAFANMIYANPNPRVFPSKEKWDLTWDVGLRLSWTINDTFSTLGASTEAQTRIAMIERQMEALKDGINLSVTAAYQEVATARSAIITAHQREDAAVASLQARRKLFRYGKATSTDIVDADAEVTGARLQRVDAHVNVWVARAKLDYAIGPASKGSGEPPIPYK